MSKINKKNRDAFKLKKEYACLKLQLKSQAFNRKNPENMIIKKVNQQKIEKIVKKKAINFEFNRQITNHTYNTNLPKNRWRTMKSNKKEIQFINDVQNHEPEFNPENNQLTAQNINLEHVIDSAIFEQPSMDTQDSIRQHQEPAVEKTKKKYVAKYRQTSQRLKKSLQKDQE